MKKIIQILFLSFCLLGTMLAQAQTVNVSGKVTDSSGETLPGAAIVIKGTSKGTVTNMDGAYTIESVPSDAVLQFSFVGMLMQEVEVGGQTTIDVSMAMDAIGIEEVVAVGYGTMKKSDLTGSVSSVKAEELVDRPSANLGQALQGKATGVLVRTSSAAPGGEVNIVIRGKNSINSGSAPLYIVDGVPLSDIHTIPVEDMESVEVLKDASSTAIYGSRGANGVILVTTKKGKVSAKPQITYNTRWTFETIPSDLNLMNGEEFATFYSEWEQARGASNVWYDGSSYDRLSASEVGQGTDWFDSVTQTGIMQNHVLSVNGGNEKTTYAMSVSYLNHKGLVQSGQYSRINIRSSLTTKITDWLDSGLDLTLSNSKKSNSGENTSMEGVGSTINQAIKMSPVLPLYNEEGGYQMNNLPGSQTQENPLATVNEIEDYDRLNRAFGNLYLKVTPHRDLSLKFSVGGDLKNNKSYYYNPTTTIYGAYSGGIANLSVSDNNYLINENIATYIKEIDNHSFNVVAGFTYEQNIYENLGAGASNFFTDAYLYNNLSAANPDNYGAPRSAKTKWSLASGLGRINYVLSNKYLVTFTGRYDGSSRFGEEYKWGFFPSIAGAWRITEESFMQDIDWLTYGKIRTSWGEVGNQNIGLYGSMEKYGLANYPIGNSIASGVAAASLANPDLRWETTQTFNVGFSAGLFNRLTIDFDYYQKKTNDLLLGVALIETSGFSSATMNTGELENKGWELGIDALVIDKAVKWNLSANIFQNRNKITKLTDPTQDWKLGYPIGSGRGYVYDGIIRNQEELDSYSDPDGVPISGAQIGDARRLDLDGDYKITGEDREVNFIPEPDFSFSMNNEVSWKAFTLSMFLYGNSGGQINNATKGYMTNTTNVRSNMTRELLSINNGVIKRNFWTEDNIDGEYPALSSSASKGPNHEDGTYLRIQNLMLSYDLPLKNVFTQSSVYFSVQNLYTFTDYTGYDPDVNGTDRAAYPVPRSFTMGLNITF